MSDAEKLVIAVAALERIKAEACMCYLDLPSECRCTATWDAATALDRINDCEEEAEAARRYREGPGALPSQEELERLVRNWEKGNT